MTRTPTTPAAAIAAALYALPWLAMSLAAVVCAFFAVLIVGVVCETYPPAKRRPWLTRLLATVLCAVIGGMVGVALTTTDHPTPPGAMAAAGAAGAIASPWLTKAVKMAVETAARR